MMRSLLPLSALLFGSALLIFAGGINALILPVRGTSEGFSALALGLLGTGWAAGYIVGCLRVPRLVQQAGHIRAFAVMAALAAVSILLSLLWMTPFAWIPLRAISGFCFAGAAMIVESWLNERTDNAARGRVFGIYTMVNLAASTAGQLVLIAPADSSDSFFVLGAIFYCLALVPMALSSTQTPRPLVSVRLDLRALWRNSPVAVFGVLMVGVSNSIYGTLAAVYAGQIGLLLTGIALFASLPVLAGAVTQIPVGVLSDRNDRRVVLIGLGVAAVLVELLFIALVPQSRWLNLTLAAVYGGAIYAMYPVIVAHANDYAPPGTFVQTSGGLLIAYGLGSIFGPLLAGAGMSLLGPPGMFLTALAAHLAMIGFALWRMRVRAAPPEAQKGSFRVSAPSRNLTPETLALAPEALDAAGELQDADLPAEPAAPEPAAEAPPVAEAAGGEPSGGEPPAAEEGRKEG